MPFFLLNLNTRPARAKYSHNVGARHSQSICRQTLVSLPLFLQVTTLRLSLSLRLYFYCSGPSGSFPLVLPITSARCSRRSAIHLYDRPCCYLFHFPLFFFSLFLSGATIYLLPPPDMMMLYALTLVPYPISRNSTMLQ